MDSKTGRVFNRDCADLMSDQEGMFLCLGVSEFVKLKVSLLNSPPRDSLLINHRRGGWGQLETVEINI